jgi:hypothetical protein
MTETCFYCPGSPTLDLVCDAPFPPFPLYVSLSLSLSLSPYLSQSLSLSKVISLSMDLVRDVAAVDGPEGGAGAVLELAALDVAQPLLELRDRESLHAQ